MTILALQIESQTKILFKNIEETITYIEKNQINIAEDNDWPINK
jgi:hypothetical protein